MPDSFGKRQRDATKARKATAREERRVARSKRRADREAGIITEEAEEGDPPEQMPGNDQLGSASSGPDPTD